eukprot:1544188-Pleurochrysis_carterae.AAC.1
MGETPDPRLFLVTDRVPQLGALARGRACVACARASSRSTRFSRSRAAAAAMAKSLSRTTSFDVSTDAWRRAKRG